MKGIFGIILLAVVHVSLFGQAELPNYLSVVVNFTENEQHYEAVKFCNKLEKSYPDNPDIYYLRGINQYLLKEYNLAIEDFDKTLLLKDDYPDALLFRAKARKASKDYFGAMRDYNKAKDQNFSQTISSLAGDLVRSVFSGK